jgi:hypothetical protein
MPSNFPTGADAIQNDIGNSTLELDLHPGLHNQLADAVMAIETQLLPGGTMNLAAQNLTAYRHEVMPANAATTVTLSNTPETVLMVARDGVIQSSAAGHYSIAGAVLTFGSAFNGSQRVVVTYTVRG